MHHTRHVDQPDDCRDHYTLHISLVYDQYGIKKMACTHSVAKARIPMTLSFFVQDICSDQMPGIGRSRMIRSRAALQIPVNIHIDR